MPVAQAAVIFGTSFVVGLSGAVTPGPLLAFTIRESALRGFRAGPYVATGHAALELVMVTLLGLGVARWLQGDAAFATIALTGAAFLLWMGWGMVRDPGHGLPLPTQAREAGADPGASRPFLGGVVVSLANPFWSLWWATVGLNFINWSQSLGLGALGFASFYLGHILSDYSWYALVSLAVASGRRMLTPAFYRGLVRVCGLFLWAMAGFFLVNGLSRVL